MAWYKSMPQFSWLLINEKLTFCHFKTTRVCARHNFLTFPPFFLLSAETWKKARGDKTLFPLVSGFSQAFSFILYISILSVSVFKRESIVFLSVCECVHVCAHVCVRVSWSASLKSRLVQYSVYTVQEMWSSEGGMRQGEKREWVSVRLCVCACVRVWVSASERKKKGGKI